MKLPSYGKQTRNKCLSITSSNGKASGKVNFCDDPLLLFLLRLVFWHIHLKKEKFNEFLSNFLNCGPIKFSEATSFL